MISIHLVTKTKHVPRRQRDKISGLTSRKNNSIKLDNVGNIGKSTVESKDNLFSFLGAGLSCVVFYGGRIFRRLTRLMRTRTTTCRYASSRKTETKKEIKTTLGNKIPSYSLKNCSNRFIISSFYVKKINTFTTRIMDADIACYPSIWVRKTSTVVCFAGLFLIHVANFRCGYYRQHGLTMKLYIVQRTRVETFFFAIDTVQEDDYTA